MSEKTIKNSKAAVGRASGRIRVMLREHGQVTQDMVLEPIEGRVYPFGRDEINEIRSSSSLVSRRHGLFMYAQGGWYYADLGSVNGTLIDNNMAANPHQNHDKIKWVPLACPCVMMIDHQSHTVSDRVEMFIGHEGKVDITSVRLTTQQPCTIGRSSKCNIVLPHVQVSSIHAVVRFHQGHFQIVDNGSTNGITVNDRPVKGSAVLKLHDVIRIGRFMMIFMGDVMEVIRPAVGGVSMQVRHLWKNVTETNGFAKKEKTLLHDVSLDIQPGELVAIVGGSGAGKTTLMNAISGFTSKTGGTVVIDGQDLDRNYASLKSIIGYVPQQDIVYDNLPLDHMLDYAARMRMPQDTTPDERRQRIKEVLEIVKMTDFRTTLIRKLSGGQKKRASIAVELLADPSLLFLDEPTSGLDAGTEESLMYSLRELTRRGKTVLLVTHSTLNLEMCDRVIAMGRGGRLCFSGHAREALRFFGVDRFAMIYDKLDNHSTEWEKRFAQGTTTTASQEHAPTVRTKKGVDAMTQYTILTRRYADIMLRSPVQVSIMVIQAFIFAVVLVLVSTDKLYVEFKDTQTVCFVTSCLSMWMGLFLSIQEITKERSILRREYMANLKLVPYILSKVTVLGVFSALQTLILQLTTVIFSLIADKNLPDVALVFVPLLENSITIFFIGLASVCMGLMISAITKQPERIAPYVLMPQIVLSGVLFDLGGAMDALKVAVLTYWGNRALCASADVNQLGVNQMGPMFEEVETYTAEVSTLFGSWAALILLSVITLAIAVVSLRKLPKEER